MIERVKLYNDGTVLCACEPMYRTNKNATKHEFILDYEDFLSLQYEYLWFNNGTGYVSKKVKSKTYPLHKYIIIQHGVFGDAPLVHQIERGNNYSKKNILISLEDGRKTILNRGIWFKRGSYELVVPIEDVLMVYGRYDTYEDALLNYKMYFNQADAKIRRIL